MVESKQGLRRADEARIEERDGFVVNREEMRVLCERLAALPEIRVERVAELRHAIHNHAFHVSTAALADAILYELAGR